MSFKLRDEHWEVLISFLEEHKDLATGRLAGLNGRERSKKLWKEVAWKLNALGFGERAPEKWQKTWIDLKYLIKKKGANVTKDQVKTGGGPSGETPFNKNDLRVIALLGDSFYQGVGESEIAQVTAGPSGLNITEEKQEKVPFRVTNTKNISRPVDHDQDQDYSYTPTPKRRKTDSTEDSYQQTITILKEIKEVIDKSPGN